MTEPNIGDTGIVRVLIPILAPDDGTPGSGDDEGTIVVLTEVADGLPPEADITNCASATPEIGLGDQSCASTAMPDLDIAKAQDVVDQVPGTLIPDVNPGDVFTYLISVTNVFDAAMYLTIYDVLDDFVDYELGTFTVNGAAALDSWFLDDILTYNAPEMISPGDLWALEFDVMVSDLTPDDWIIRNSAVITTFTDPLDPWGSAFVPIVTNEVVVRVENPDVIPEPSTLLLFGTGLVGLLALVHRRRKLRR